MDLGKFSSKTKARRQAFCGEGTFQVIEKTHGSHSLRGEEVIVGFGNVEGGGGTMVKHRGRPQHRGVHPKPISRYGPGEEGPSPRGPAFTLRKRGVLKGGKERSQAE